MGRAAGCVERTAPGAKRSYFPVSLSQPNAPQTFMHLLYFADPLCSWCYGFGLELAEFLQRHPEARVDLVMGGLRAGNSQPMSEAFKEMLRGHWAHVGKASGLPFSESILDREGFVYDTEPPCRGVVTARTIDPAKSFTYFKALQDGFYRDGRDVTRALVMSDIAEECGYDRVEFLGALESVEMREATRNDFSMAQSLGVSGFPTLAAARGPQLYLVTSGYVTDDVLAQRVAEIERLTAQQTPAS
jgi:putative protein-disulfide isomerase